MKKIFSNLKWLWPVLLILVAIISPTFTNAYANNENNARVVWEPINQNWELGLVFYDSAVNNGTTPLTSINWDASNGGYGEGEPRVIKVQINYKNSNALRTYDAGELQISVPNLIYGNTWRSGSGTVSDLYGCYEAQWNGKAIVGANDSTHTGYDWDFISAANPNNTQENYVFSNNKRIEENANFEGSIMIEYTITPTAERFSYSYNTDCCYVEKYQNTCTHNYDTDIQATLFNNNETLAISNSMPFNYTRTYTHEWKRYDYKFESSVEKITSYDGLPANAKDFIWVKYVFNVNGQENDNNALTIGLKNQLTEGINDDEAKLHSSFPENCVVYDWYGQKIEPISGDEYVVNGFNDYHYHYYGKHHKYLFVGYPKSIYNNQNNNMKITNNADLYLYYKDGNDFEYHKTATTTLNLSEFEFDYEGELYGITKTAEGIYDGRGYTEIMRYQDILAEEGFNRCFWKHEIVAYYTGSPMTIKIGDDVMFATDKDDNFVQLKDDEYYVSEITFPVLKNGSGQQIAADEYDCELWVRYADEKDYELKESFKTVSSTKTWTFLKNDAVVGYYFLIKDMRESINGANFYNYVNVIKKDISESGTIYNFDYVQVFFRNQTGDLIVQNNQTIDSYASFASREQIASFDIETYGTYIQRSCDKVVWELYDAEMGQSLMANHTTTAVTQNAKDECFEGTFTIGAEIYGDDQYNEIYKDYYPADDIVYGFVVYDLLPKGMELTSTVDEIIQSAKISSTGNSSSGIVFLDKNFNVLSTTTVLDIIKRSTTVNIVENWKGTGRTWVEIKSDFKDTPFYSTSYSSATYNACRWFSFNLDYKLSYDNFLTYGSTYNNYCYADYTEQIMGNKTVRAGGDSKRKLVTDNGQLDAEAIDIDCDNKTDDKLVTCVGKITISSVISTHQDIQTQVETIGTNYSIGTVSCSINTNYSYKLRARTGSNFVTNLVIIDNLEEAYGDNKYWKGSFLGIDTSFAENRVYKIYDPSNQKADPNGYVDKKIKVKTYYSQNEKESVLYQTVLETVKDEYGNTIYNEDGTEFQMEVRAVDSNGNFIKNANWLEYNDSVDKTKVKSLAFEFLDSESESAAIIPANELVFVEVLMKSPFDFDLLDDMNLQYAYNNCFTQWNAIDEFDETVDFITGMSSNVVKVSVVDEFSIAGNKTWEQDEESNRPNAITINLLQNGQQYTSTTITASDNWEYRFTNLPLIDTMNDVEYNYTVEEVAVDGYETTYSNGVDIVENPTVGYYEIINTRNASTIELSYIKTDFFTKLAIEDVSFDLYKLVCANNDANHDHGKVEESSCWSYITSKVSDNSGTVTLDELSTGCKYGLIENVPNGYELPTDLYWLLDVSADSDITWNTMCDQNSLDVFNDVYGWTGYNLDVEKLGDGFYEIDNVSRLREVEVVKQIKTSDINFANGNPTFVFKLNGIDVTGQNKTFYKSVEFTEEYVLANTDQDGNVSMRTFFSNLIPGSYVLEEVTISRYCVEDIINILSGVKKNDVVCFDLISNSNGSASYINKKYEISDFSHNSIVINNLRK